MLQLASDRWSANDMSEMNTAVKEMEMITRIRIKDSMIVKG